MGFQSDSQTVQQEQSVPIEQLNSEIKRLGVKIAELKDQEALYQDRTKENEHLMGVIFDLNLEVEDKKKELDALAAELKNADDTLIQKRVEQETERKTFQDTIDRLYEDIKIIGSKKEIALIDLAAVREDVVRLEKDITDRIEQFNIAEEKRGKKIIELDGVIKERIETISEFESEITDLQMQISDLGTVKLLRDNLLKVIESNRLEVVSLGAEIDNLKQLRDKTSKQMDEDLIKFNEDRAAEQAALDTRDGELSKRDAYLKDKEARLRNAKIELEKQTGKNLSITI